LGRWRASPYARPATRPTTFFSGGCSRLGSVVPEGRATPPPPPPPPRQKHEISFLAQQRFLLNPPLGATFIVNSEPRSGERRSVRVCAELKTLPLGSFVITAKTPRKRARSLARRGGETESFFFVLKVKASCSLCGFKENVSLNEHVDNGAPTPEATPRLCAAGAGGATTA
jgi:hypothetical protein